MRTLKTVHYCGAKVGHWETIGAILKLYSPVSNSRNALRSVVALLVVGEADPHEVKVVLDHRSSVQHRVPIRELGTYLGS